MTRSVPEGELRPLGDRALLIGVDDASSGRVLAVALRERLRHHGVEVVGGSATVLVAVTDAAADAGAVRAEAAQVTATFAAGPAGAGETSGDGRLVTIPCAFDGPDLDEVARLAGCGPAEVVAQLTAQPLSVSVMGFAPGFAYLDGLPAPLRAVPRRDSPRPRVPAGSVALANGHAAVYPAASPGGWHLVGRTGVPLFSSAAPPYAVLAPGDRVALRAAPGDVAAPEPEPAPGWDPPEDARPVFEVRRPGLRAVLQDGGRRGVAAAGIPWAGPADGVSLALANRLVGNPDDSAALEITAGGTALRSLGHAHVAVVGAAPEVRVGGSPVGAGRVTPVSEGQRLEIGPIRGGCRTYLAVAGGLLGPRVFDSVASDELAALGPGALGSGARLHAGRWSPPLGDHLSGSAPDSGATPRDGVVMLRVLPGPHREAFVAGAMAALARCAFVVANDSNRVGIRLRADGGDPVPRPLERAAELDSHGVVTGVVQVPPGGQPVVLLPDHATLGGYPVLAVVIAADLARLGQCGPGTRLRLVPVEAEEAAAAWRSLRRALDGAVAGHYPLEAG